MITDQHIHTHSSSTYGSTIISTAGILIAPALTGVVGFEREKAKKAAGLRTNMIIGGVWFLANIGPILILRVSTQINEAAIRTDPLRIVEALKSSSEDKKSQ